MRILSRLVGAGLGGIALFAVGASPASATEAATTTTLPVGFSTFVPCAAQGAGEEITLSGPLHSVFHATQNNAGGTRIDVQFNAMGISGQGQTTGTTYRGTGSTMSASATMPAGTSETSFVDNFRLIGPGPGNNFTVHANIHVGLDASLTVTAQIENVRIDCS